MAVPFRSIDDALANDNTKGSMTRLLTFASTGTTTAATSTSGYTSWKRHPIAFTVPTFTGNAYMTHCRVYNSANAGQTAMVALETLMGSIALSTGTFTDNNAMPTRTIGGGSSAQLATTMPMLYVSTALTATTPTITTTYVNQAGTGSKSCALTLPTSPVINTGFAMAPHLASGDTGMQDITNITKSAGTAGTLQVLGLLPLSFAGITPVSTAATPLDVLAQPQEMYPIVAGDTISFWYAPGTTGVNFMVAFQLQAEV